MTSRTVWICCGVLQAELKHLHDSGRIDGEIMTLDSMLHMDPHKLESALTGELERLRHNDLHGVLVYGDCCSGMLDLVKKFNMGRVNAINCPQMLLGRARYRELMHDQAFMFLPEWAIRWKEIFECELGLNRNVARDFMRDNRREIVYLDTGLAELPLRAMEECSAYTGLPWRSEEVKLDNLLSLLLEARALARASHGTE